MGRSPETDEWGVGEKVSVDVGSLAKLAQQIKDDMDTFHHWVEVWQQTGSETNPSNAQFTGMAGSNNSSDGPPAGAAFAEGAYAEARNNGYFYGQMRGLVLLIQMGLGSLHGGANFLSTMYPGVDGYNNVRLGMVEDMFPEIPLKNPAEIGPNTPPGQGWTKAKDGKGWDTDGDGDTDVEFTTSGGPPADLDDGSSVNSRPGAVAGSTHSGYDRAIDTNKIGDGGLDGASQADLRNNIDEGEANMPIARAGEDVFDFFVDTGEAIDDLTDGENNPGTAGPW